MERLDNKKIGAKLRELRGDRSQAEIAEGAGVTAMAISQYERGERIPNDVVKMRLAILFNKSVEELFFTL